MKKTFRTLLFCGLLCLLLSFVLTASADDLPTNYAKALKYVKKIQPMEAVASNIGWNPKQLTELKAALPDGAVFHFTCKWNGISFSDDSEELDLTKAEAHPLHENERGLVRWQGSRFLSWQKQ